MKIKTDFDMDQEVFYMKDNKVVSTEIKEINAKVDNEYNLGTYTPRTSIKYTIRENRVEVIKLGREIYTSKEDLLDSL